MARRASLLVGVLLLAACHAPLAPKPVKPTATAAATDLPPSADVTPEARPAALLKAPATAHVTLAGKVTVDAGYMVASGHGRVAGNTVVAADAALVAAGGGNVISDHGAGILANNGGTLISNNGGTILSDGASNLLAAADADLVPTGAPLLAIGGGLIGKVKYGLAEAGPALGQLLPAAGMAVFVLDLRTGALVPVGVDDQARPVYVVHADAAGGYTLYLPKDLATNVRVVAVAPGPGDPRLVYSLVTGPAAATDASIDEERATATRYMRGTLVAYLTNGLVTHTKADADVFAPTVGDFVTAVEQAGVDKLDRVHAERVMQATADAILAYADLSTLQADYHNYAWSGPTEPAMPVLVAFLHAVYTKAAAKLDADPHAFDQRPFFVDANRRRAAAGLPPYAIAKPADLGELIFHEYMNTSDKEQQWKLQHLLADLGIPQAEYMHLRGAYAGMFEGLAAQMLASDEARAAAAKVIASATKAELARQAGEPAPSPSPAAPARPAVTVATFAGGGGPDRDGAATAVDLGSPSGFAADGHGHLYFADLDGNCIRRIDLESPDHAVSTVAGSTGPAGIGHQDGAADQARFHGPVRLAYDGQQTPPVLYVGESDNHDVRAIALPDGGPAVVSTLAGGPTSGFADGPGAAARFDQPLGLALDGQGHLLVADRGNGRLRRIDLADPAHPVSTVAGSAPPPDGTPGFVVGDPLAAAFGTLEDVIADGKGGLYLLERTRVDHLGAGSPALVTVLGNAHAGETDGFWAGALLDDASCFALDAHGRLVIGEETGESVRLATPTGPDAFDLVTLAGMPPATANGLPQRVDGPGDRARFGRVFGVLPVDGTLYIGDFDNRRIRTLQLP